MRVFMENQHKVSFQYHCTFSIFKSNFVLVSSIRMSFRSLCDYFLKALIFLKSEPACMYATFAWFSVLTYMCGFVISIRFESLRLVMVGK